MACSTVLQHSKELSPVAHSSTGLITGFIGLLHFSFSLIHSTAISWDCFPNKFFSLEFLLKHLLLLTVQTETIFYKDFLYLTKIGCYMWV